MAETSRRLRVLDGRDHATELKVAFATSDRRHVDQHFAWAASLAIYGVSPDSAALLAVSEFDQPQSGDEQKLPARLDWLADCIAVYCCACGASAVQQLLERGVQPVKVSEGAEISELIAALQEELREGPSNWLARAIKQQRNIDPSFFGFAHSEMGED